MKKTIVVLVALVSVALGSAIAFADSQSDLARVREATARYHRLPAALAEGFVAFSLEGTDEPTCFDSQAGGMGVHYVRNIDGSVDAADPEALVYEVGADGRLSLVAVEYIVPESFVEDAEGNPVNLPELFGVTFHKHTFLPVYILHAWIWRWNPDGMFVDFNPRVEPCP